MSTSHWEGGELGRWERCVSGVRWQGGKGETIVRWHGEECNGVAIWERWEGSEERRWDGIMLYCSREAKC